MIKAVLFDMDGTLTDTEKYYCSAWKEAFHKFGYEDFTFEDALGQRSLNTHDAKARWIAKYGDDLDYDALHDYVNQTVDQRLSMDGIALKPGIRETLSYLRSHGYHSAVVTATEYGRASQRLKSLGIFDIFDTVLSAHNVSRGKPYPDVYLYACQEVGLKPSECLAVEDSPNGVHSAHAAGCPVVMVPDLTQPNEELKKILSAVCKDLTGIIPLLEQSSDADE